MAQASRPLAMVTGASTGIGYELAKNCAENGFDLVVAADEPSIMKAAREFRALGAHVEAVEADLGTLEGVDKLYAAARGLPIDALIADAGGGLGKGFLDQDFAAARRMLDTNVTGTIYLIHKVAREMRGRGKGRILVTGSVGGIMPASLQTVYNGIKAFLDSFTFALQAELKKTGVTVTCLMPRPTETDFFDRADRMDASIGQAGKDDPAEGAKGRLRGDDARRRRYRHRVAEQGAGGDRPRSALGNGRRTAV